MDEFALNNPLHASTKQIPFSRKNNRHPRVPACLRWSANPLMAVLLLVWERLCHPPRRVTTSTSRASMSRVEPDPASNSVATPFKASLGQQTFKNGDRDSPVAPTSTSSALMWLKLDAKATTNLMLADGPSASSASPQELNLSATTGGGFRSTRHGVVYSAGQHQNAASAVSRAV